MNHYFQSPPVFSPPAGIIDFEKGIIRGITIAKIGPAKGHDGLIDKTFLLQLVNMAASRPQGIKARFGHPNMCATALGTYLGRFFNYSSDGSSVTADLHLDDSARYTPNGNLFDYVLKMAQSNPDMFGASIVFEAGEFEFSESVVDGKLVKTRLFRLKELRATDIVDEPAATNGLFSADSVPALATQFLDQNPALAEFIFSKPESVIEFFNNYLSNADMNLSDKIKSNFRKLFNLEADPPVSLDSTADSLSENPDIPAPDSIQLTSDDASSEVGLQNQILFDETLKSLDEALTKLNDLAAENSLLKAQLSARPTLPNQVTDPQISLKLGSPDKDDTGKTILAQLPRDLRQKLK